MLLCCRLWRGACEWDDTPGEFASANDPVRRSVEQYSNNAFRIVPEVRAVTATCADL